MQRQGKVTSFRAESLEDAMRLLKDVQLIIQDKYDAVLELGYHKFIISIYVKTEFL